MIRRKKQIITQEYHSKAHKGIDLRCIDEKTYKPQPVIAPETVTVIRKGIDSYGNKFIVYATKDYEFKSIHVRSEHSVGDIILEKEIVGWCEVGGNSNALHEHFEIWQHGKPINPTIYFDIAGIAYDRKNNTNTGNKTANKTSL